MDTYPVTFSVEYPDRPLNRVTTAFRIFTVIPIAIVLGALEHASGSVGQASSGQVVASAARWSRPGGADAALPPEVPALVV